MLAWVTSGNPNDELWEARRWAIELAKQYAAAEGISLVARDDG